MPSYDRIKGLPVVTVAEGKKVGTVDGMVMDPDQKKVGWLRLHSGGLIGGEHFWIPGDAVRGIGEHAVTINSESDVRSPEEAQQVEELLNTGRTLVGKKVVSEAGNHLGEIRDLELAPNSLGLAGVLVSQGGGFGGKTVRIAANHVLTIGPDLVIVSNDALSQAEDAGYLADPRRAEAEDARQAVAPPRAGDVRPDQGAESTDDPARDEDVRRSDDLRRDEAMRREDDMPRDGERRRAEDEDRRPLT